MGRRLTASEMFLLVTTLLPLGALASDVLYDGDDCGIYPPCHQYGEGVWQILEDCRRYINCTRQPDGQLTQQNMMCPGDLVFTNEYHEKPGEGECVDYDRATECKVFQETPCLFSCPRVYLSSNGPAFDSQYRRIGCFRISGGLFGNTMVHFQNQNGQYLTPDSMSTPFSIKWIVSESPMAFNGGIKNSKFDYIHFPFDGWNQGWEADVGGGHWAADNTMKVTCHRGDEGASTDAPPVTQTTTEQTAPPQNCYKDGPNAISDCSEDFICCKFNNADHSWKETSCKCNNGNVFVQDFDICTWPDIAGCTYKRETWGFDLELRNDDYTCDGGVKCEGYP